MTSIVYLLGSPGVGKRTIGRALAQRTGAVCVDNQTINLPVIGLFKWDGKSQLPPEIWSYIDDMRDTVLSALERLAPPQLSYVFTNALQSDAAGEALFRRIEHIAQQRGATFVPVLLTCEREEQLRRVSSPDRVARYKLSDADDARALIESTEFYVPHGPGALTLDTTDTSAEEATRAIELHTAALQGEPHGH